MYNSADSKENLLQESNSLFGGLNSAPIVQLDEDDGLELHDIKLNQEQTEIEEEEDSLQDSNHKTTLQPLLGTKNFTPISRGKPINGKLSDQLKWELWRELGVMKEFAMQTGRNIKRSKVNFCLGFCACFVVVTVVALLLTVLASTPVVFLRLSELQAGETDLTVYVTGNERLNYTQMISILTNIPPTDKISNPNDYYSYHSPRVTGTVSTYKSSQCRMKMGQWICAEPGRSVYIYIINSEREKHAGIGREWNLPSLEEGEMYLSESTARDVGAKEGDTVYVRLELGSLLGNGWKMVEGTKKSSDTFFVPFRIKQIISDTYGKLPIRYTRFMFMEYEKFIPYLRKQLEASLTVSESQRFKTLHLNQYAQQVLFNLPQKMRMEYYIDSNYDAIQDRLTSFASVLMYKLGFNVLGSTMRILVALRTFNIFSLFLGLIINVIIFILLFICTLLIYSLLITNVETRTFEIGILRMFGTKRYQVVLLLVFQALSYIVFSYPLGLGCAQLLLNYLASGISELIGIKFEPVLTGRAVLLAAFLGIGMPLISSIFPIRAALGKNLHDSIDVRQSKTKAVKIQVDRSEAGSLDWNLLIIGISLAAFGFGIYYLMPYSLLSFNLEILLYLFIALLLNLLLGATILSLNAIHILEKGLVHLLFFWDSSAIRSVVIKNFVAHRVRNQKTSILYAISLAFIVFISVSYSIQLQSFLYQQQQREGALIKVSSTNGYFRPTSDAPTVYHLLENFAEKSDYVATYGWISQPLTVVPGLSATRASNIGHVYSDSFTVYAVSPGLFDAALKEYISIESSNENSDTLLPSLYTTRGSYSAIVGTKYKQFMGLHTGTHFLLNIEFSLTNNSDAYVEDTELVQQSTTVVDEEDGVAQIRIRKRLITHSLLSGAPAFRFSKFPLQRGQSSLVSYPTYLRLSHGVFKSVEDIPVRDFLIKMKSGMSDNDIDELIRQIESTTSSYSGLSIYDYRDEVETIDTASSILAYFFNFTTLVAMLVCFFSLNSSMYTNILEQAKEIAILRAMGISRWWMYRIYTYESIVIVLSSSLLGTLIGCFVGYTMVLQRILFTQLPIPFVLPSGILITVSISSLIFSILSSFGPVHSLMKQSIVSVMRFVF